MKKAGLQSVIAITLLMGNISTPSMDVFYEDDASFNEVATALTSGWGWGISSAHAKGDPNCTSMDECYGTTHQPPDTHDVQWWLDRLSPDSRDTTDYDDRHRDNNGGGGSSNSKNTNNKRIEECKTEKLVAKNNCLTTAETLFVSAAAMCLKFRHFGVVAACEGIAVVAKVNATGDCDENYQKAIRQCK